jgi:Zn-dependent peptidase ImmA (M78 family)/DNA-binding XRE family transcriptional regulator
MSNLVPQRITQARELAGQTKTDLAEKLNVSVAAVSQWENGSKNPADENLICISRILNVPLALLFVPIPKELSCRGPITFRARSASKTSLRKRAQRLSEMVAEIFLWLEKWVTFPATSLPEISSMEDPEAAASECRRAWGLSDRPIGKLGELLESKGIRLSGASFGDIRFDAYSCIVSGRPFVFLGSEKLDRARSRFDAGHELGHLLLHQHYSDEELQQLGKDAEAQANAFAGAFLMPAETFSKDLLDTKLDAFKRIKPKWGVSIQAMVRRAHDLDLISQETYEKHNLNMSTYGWRRARSEPLDETVPIVNKTLGKRSLELLITSTKIKAWEIPSELPLPESVFESVFEAKPRAMVPMELNDVIVKGVFPTQIDSPELPGLEKPGA